MLQTIIATMGGLGLFLLGMGIMTEGLKASAGSALRSVLAGAAATPLSGTFWGAAVTLLVQSSSATTMTTIGLVSSGLLSFPQGLSLVFGANLGTTGTAWIIALLGVKFSLTGVAMPMICVGALVRLFGRGRWSGAGAALAGFGLLFLGLTTLQTGMGGIAERINPADLPGVIGGAGVGVVAGIGGLLLLVLVGIVLTTLMQSSSAAMAVTLSALHAGALGPDQAIALVIGQNIGTTTSALLAAIGATTPAKRTAAAHVGFNIVTGTISMVLFPLIVPVMLWASRHADPPTLLALFHTLYKLVGIAVLLPVIESYARLIERIVPERGVSFTRTLDRSVLGLPEIAVEASRRAVALVLASVGMRVAGALDAAERMDGSAAGSAEPAVRRSRQQRTLDGMELERADAALDEVRMFLSAVAEPPSGERERQRMASTVHALDHAARLVEALRDEPSFRHLPGVEDKRARALCEEMMRLASRVADNIAHPGEPRDGTALHGAADQRGTLRAEDTTETDEHRVARLGELAARLADLRRAHRGATLRAAASGELTAGESMVRVETVRHLDRIAYHGWRAAAHLAGAVEHAGRSGPDGGGEPVDEASAGG